MATLHDLFEFMRKIESGSSLKIQYVHNNLNELFGNEKYSDKILNAIKQSIYRVSSELFKR